MRDYFSNLITGLKYYTDVKISSTEVANMKVSDLKQIGTNLYMCTCQYTQRFVGCRDGIPVYTDKTTKTINCYIEKEETEDGTEYVIMLGDVYANYTE